MSDSFSELYISSETKVPILSIQYFAALRPDLVTTFHHSRSIACGESARVTETARPWWTMFNIESLTIHINWSRQGFFGHPGPPTQRHRVVDFGVDRYVALNDDTVTIGASMRSQHPLAGTVVFQCSKPYGVRAGEPLQHFQPSYDFIVE